MHNKEVVWLSASLCFHEYRLGRINLGDRRSMRGYFPLNYGLMCRGEIPLYVINEIRLGVCVQAPEMENDE